MVVPLLLAAFVFAALVAYQLARPRLHDCKPIDERPVRVVRGRVVGPKAAGKVVCRIDQQAQGAAGEGAGIGAAELPLIVDFAGDKVLVLACGAVVSAHWPHRRRDLRVGDRIAVAGVLGDLRREEALYRESGCAFGLEALRIVAGGLPPLRGLMVPTIASGALTLGCLLLLLTPLGTHSAPLSGLPCPAGTRLEGRPAVLGATAWTQTCRDAGGRAQGPTVRWSKAGSRLSEGTYRDGRLEGTWTAWQGSQRTVWGAYRAGRRDGLWREWTATGRPRSRGHYRQGHRQGRWTVWGGVCRDRGGLLPTSDDGAFPHRLHYLGEVRQMACTYRAGRLHGPFSLRLKTGAQLQGHFLARPKGRYEAERASQYDGRWTWWNAAGQKLLESHYRRGSAHGRWIRWSAAGQRQLEGRYDSHDQQTRMSGRWTRYRPDGTVAWACAFADGLAAGWLPPCRQERYRCRNLSSKCDARLADVLPGRPQVHGALSMAEVEGAVYQQLGGLSNCEHFGFGPRGWSAHALQKAGQLTIGLKIRGGWVEGAWVTRSTLGQPSVSDCMADVLAEAEFRPDARTTTVSYSFEVFPERYVDPSPAIQPSQRSYGEEDG